MLWCVSSLQRVLLLLLLLLLLIYPWLRRQLRLLRVQVLLPRHTLLPLLVLLRRRWLRVNILLQRSRPRLLETCSMAWQHLRLRRCGP